MNVFKIYEGSNGEATKALYAQLETYGPIGFVALNLFRAAKCSGRAKVYRGRYFKDAAYGRKQWSLQNLCRVLGEHAQTLNIKYGWREDPTEEYHKWVLYVELPTGQVSFHTDQRGTGPDYVKPWDGARLSGQRIVVWISNIVGELVLP